MNPNDQTTNSQPFNPVQNAPQGANNAGPSPLPQNGSPNSGAVNQNSSFGGANGLPAYPGQPAAQQPFTPGPVNGVGQQGFASPSPQGYSNPGPASQGMPTNSYGPFPPPGSASSPNLPDLPIPGSPPNSSQGQAGASNLPPTNVRQEVIEHLKKANNVLVTVSNNPSADQLSAAIAITLVLNKLNKHATAVYSGKTPSTLEFLEPEKTIEKNTNSLRDFIIALDKAKADKLRYKVEDQFVKIFITPYHTSINEEDLEFSQGDFNVDVVLALGVHQKTELDQAITAHGRILHDAVTISVNNNKPAELGNVNWYQADASSICEMLVGLIEPLQGDRALLDKQIATGFLTGVVAETERFSNNKTTPRTMNVSATLMKAGANQQLVATKLQEPKPVAEGFDGNQLDKLAKENPTDTPVPTPKKDGSLEIEHKPGDNKPDEKKPSKTLFDLEKENKSKVDGDADEDSSLAKIHIDDNGSLHLAGEEPKKADKPEDNAPKKPSNMILEKPSIGGDLSSATKENKEEPVVAAVDKPATDDSTNIKRAKTIEPLNDSSPNTLSDIEQAVNSPHINKTDTAQNSGADAAREQVQKASTFGNSQRPEPIAALNATPVDIQKDDKATSDANDQKPPTPIADQAPSSEKPKAEDLTTEEVFPPQLVGPDKGPGPDPTASKNDSPSSPPPVPPPIVPNV